MAKNETPRSKYEPPAWFWESRKKGPSVSGTVLFSTLRALDLPLQWYMLHSGGGIAILRRIGLATVASTPHSLLVNPTAIGLSPYHTLILGLATGSSLKQIYWKIFVGDTVMPSSFSAVVCAYNTVLNTVNMLFALSLATSQQPRDQSSFRAMLLTAPPTVYVGMSLYAVGLFTEWYSEVQRKAYKAKVENQGKPYAEGLFGLARNINYGGYTLWRTGYALVCGGWIWAGANALWLGYDFCARAIPSLDAYCEKRYGEQWQEVRRKVPYRLLPGVW